MNQQSQPIRPLLLLTIVTTGLTLTLVPAPARFSWAEQPLPRQSQQLATQPQVTVTIAGFQFEPASLTVKVGSSVTFTNKDSAPHTVTPAQGATFTGTGRIESNQSKTIVFKQVGNQPYVCELHPSMKGAINVVK